MSVNKVNSDGSLTMIAGRGTATDTLKTDFSTVETTSTSTRAYNQGDSFIMETGQLVKATTAIAIGDTIAIGTNVVATSVAELLANKVDKEAGKGLSTNNYDNTAKGIVDSVTTNLATKADKVSSATNGNLAGLNGSGNLTDSGWNGAKDTTSISGNPISISGLKANQLAVNPIITLEPIQDLHGQGKPYPAGGGKNKFAYTVESIKAINTAGTWSGNVYTVNGGIFTIVTDSANNVIAIDINTQSGGITEGSMFYLDRSTVLPTETYYLSGCADGGSASGSYRLRVTINGTQYNNYNSQDDVSVSSGGNVDLGIQVYRGWTSTTKVRFYPMIRLQSESDRTFASPSNISPITGYDKIEILSANGSDPTAQGYVKATSISESFGQTVYWGRLNVRTGEFEVLGKIIRLNSLQWGYADGYFNVSIGLPADCVTVAILHGYKCFSSKYNAVQKGYLSMQSGELVLGDTGWSSVVRLIVKDSRFTDVTSFTNSLTNDDTLVYPLAAPFTIQLTPQEIILLSIYAYVSTNGTNISLDYHNGELASLADVAQVGETVNELGKALTHTRLNVAWGNVSSGTTYSYNLTSAIPTITVDTLRAISIMVAKGASNQDAQGIYNYRMSSSGTDIVLQYHCALTQNSAVSVVDVLYQS